MSWDTGVMYTVRCLRRYFGRCWVRVKSQRSVAKFELTRRTMRKML